MVKILADENVHCDIVHSLREAEYGVFLFPKVGAIVRYIEETGEALV